jgi:hypothetical protein
VHLNRFLFAGQLDAQTHAFAFRIDRKLRHFSDTSQMSINGNPRGKSDRRIF